MAQTSEIAEKSKAFALRILRLSDYLRRKKHESVLGNQLLRSGTSIGANVREASRAQSRADFYTEMTIALKEADESAYWLELLHEGGILDQKQFDSMYRDCQELICLLVAITKTVRENS